MAAIEWTRAHSEARTDIAYRTVQHCLASTHGLCVIPRFLKQFLAGRLRGIPSYWLRHYVAARLEVVIRFAKALARDCDDFEHREFSTFCGELADATGPQAVSRKLGLEITDDYFFCTWEEWAAHCRTVSDRVGALYCMVNAWLQLDFRPDVPGIDGWRNAWALWESEDFRQDMPAQRSIPADVESAYVIRLAQDFGQLRYHSMAAETFEIWLGIVSRGIYADLDHIRAVLRRSAFAEIDDGGIRDDVARTFVKVLRNIGIPTGSVEIALSQSHWV